MLYESLDKLDVESFGTCFKIWVTGSEISYYGRILANVSFGKIECLKIMGLKMLQMGLSNY